MAQPSTGEIVSELQQHPTVPTPLVSADEKLPAISHPPPPPEPTLQEPQNEPPVATLLASIDEKTSAIDTKTAQHQRARDYAHRMAAKLLATHGAQNHTYLYFGRCVEVYAEAVMVCEVWAKVLGRRKEELCMVLANLREWEDTEVGEREIVVQRAKEIVEEVERSQGVWERRMMMVLGQLDWSGLRASGTSALAG